MQKFKTLKQNAKIRVTVNGTSQCLTVKQAVEQFLDGGIIIDVLTRLDIERQENKEIHGIGGQFSDKMIQIDLY